MVRRVNPLRPDMVVLTGDFISYSPLPSVFARRFAPGCASILSGIDARCAMPASATTTAYWAALRLRPLRGAWHSGADEFRSRAGAGRAAPVAGRAGQRLRKQGRSGARDSARRREGTGHSAGARAGHPARYRALQCRPDALRTHPRRTGEDSLSAAAAPAQVWRSGMSRAFSGMVPRSCT